MAQVLIYRTPYCGYCDMAKRLLDGLGVDYEQIDVSGDADARRKLVERTGQRTVPQIFIDGKSIGGYQELQALHRSGELQKLLSLSD